MKNQITFGILACIFLPSHAQIDMSKLKITYTEVNRNSIVSEAVTPALTIIRQQYHLERKGDYYGKGGKEYYGESYTLGVKIGNFTLLPHSTVFPWEHDEDYKRVNADSKYRPQRFRTMQHGLNDSVWHDVDFDFANYVTTRTADSLLLESQDRIADFGLSIEESAGNKQGYMIWAYSTTNTVDSAMHVELSQHRFDIEINEAGNPIEVNPENISNVLGGVFVVTQVERPGYIKVSLAGVAVADTQGKWLLEPMAAKRVKKDIINEPTVVEKAKKEKKEKKAKEEKDAGVADEAEPTPVKK